LNLSPDKSLLREIFCLLIVQKPDSLISNEINLKLKKIVGIKYIIPQNFDIHLRGLRPGFFYCKSIIYNLFEKVFDIFSL